MKKHNGMRPQDVVVLLKIMAEKNKCPRVIDISKQLLISASEVSEALHRCKIAGLIDPNKRKVNLNSLRDFLVYGLKYVFPVEPGRIVEGLATASSAYPMSVLIPYHDNFVWPCPNAGDRGQAIEPLYKTVPMIAKKDKALYELLAIADTLRIGRELEFHIARRQLAKRIYKTQLGR